MTIPRNPLLTLPVRLHGTDQPLCILQNDFRPFFFVLPFDIIESERINTSLTFCFLYIVLLWQRGKPFIPHASLRNKNVRGRQKNYPLFYSLFIFRTQVDLLSCWVGGSKVL